MAEILRHVGANKKTIRRRPRPRLVMQELELQWKMIAVRLDERIHAGHICLQKPAICRRQVGNALFGHLLQRENALLPVMQQEIRAQDLRHLPAGKAAGDVELPQPVLRRHVALGKQQVTHVLRPDVRHSLRVAQHAHRRAESGQPDASIQLRQHRAGAEIYPAKARNQNGSHRQDKQQQNSQQSSGRRDARARRRQARCGHEFFYCLRIVPSEGARDRPSGLSHFFFCLGRGILIMSAPSALSAHMARGADAPLKFPVL